MTTTKGAAEAICQRPSFMSNALRKHKSRAAHHKTHNATAKWLKHGIIKPWKSGSGRRYGQ